MSNGAARVRHMTLRGTVISHTAMPPSPAVLADTGSSTHQQQADMHQHGATSASVETDPLPVGFTGYLPLVIQRCVAHQRLELALEVRLVTETQVQSLFQE